MIERTIRFSCRAAVPHVFRANGQVVDKHVERRCPCNAGLRTVVFRLTSRFKSTTNPDCPELG